MGSAWAFQRKLIYHPDERDLPEAGSVLAGAHDVPLRTDDGLELRAWFAPPAPGSADRGVTVLVAHGNAGNAADRAPLAEALTDRGFSVLMLEYRGYGGNPGAPSERGLELDARAAYWYLRNVKQVPPERLLYFGESLGSGVVTALATKYPPAGMVLRSPFTDLAAAGGRLYPFLPVSLLIRDRFPVAETVKRLAAPTAVVYGDRDDVVPASMSEQVANAVRNLFARVEIPGAGHNDLVMLVGDEVLDTVEELAKHIVA